MAKRVRRGVVAVIAAGVLSAFALLSGLPGGTDSAQAGSWCPSRSVCLYTNANFGGGKVTYSCQGWAPGSYRSWDLRGYFPPYTHSGVSSYHSTLRNASLGIHLGGWLPIGGRAGNVPGWANDKAYMLSVVC